MTTAKIQNIPAAKHGNELEKAKRVQFSTFIKNSGVQKSLIGTLGDAAKAKTFTASIISAVSTNPNIANCEPMSIISAALLGESLKLSPSPQLGQYYLVPYGGKATFQLGWKGYNQLAMRSGQYKKMDVVEVKEGELKSYNPFTGEAEFEPITDPEAREHARVIGYYAYFVLVNGYTKTLYWSREKMNSHALRYSKSYAKRNGSSFWEKDFDEMAKKTMYRQLIGKYGIMSIDMQKAFEGDMTIQGDITAETGSEEAEPVYFDAVTTETEVDPETGEIITDTEKENK